jgi:hypothetical protein
MKKHIFKSLVLFLAVTTLSSCLKDDRLVLDPEKGHNVIEFGNTSTVDVAGSTVPLYINSFALGKDATLEIPINYAGPESGAPEDITVTISILGTETIDAYNDEQHDELELMTPNTYSIPSMTVVIPKGQRKAMLQVNIKPDLFDLTAKYGLPLKISSVSSGIISGNFGTAIYSIGAKNRLDGLYNYKTSATTSLKAGANDNNVPLTTSGPTTVTANLVNTYTNIVTYSVDPTTNKATVTNSGGIGDPITDPSSNYNPETKVLYVKWTAGARQFEETYTYTGER